MVFPKQLWGCNLVKCVDDSYAFYEKESYGFLEGIEIRKKVSKINGKAVYEVKQLTGNRWKITTWVIVCVMYYKSIEDIINDKPLSEEKLLKYIGVKEGIKWKI